MRLIVFILSIYSFIKTISFGIFEYKKNSNKIAGIIICILSVFLLILVNII